MLNKKLTLSCGCLQKERASKYKSANLIGKTFGKLLVIERYGSNKRNQVQWVCKCECGNKTICTTNSLNSGKVSSCGCFQKLQTSKARLNNLTGKVFGKLKVVKRDDNYKSKRRVKWLCKCECGKQVSVTSDSLTGGHTKSCGCLRGNPLHRLIDITGKRYGKLVVLEYSGKSTWLCRCDCGNIKIVAKSSLKQGLTKSCGCLNESWIANQLKIFFKENHNAISEYKMIRNPETKAWLKCDIYIPENFYVEVNGKQHYKHIGWNMSEEEYKKLRKRDRIKKSFAKKNGVYIEIDLRKIKSVEEAKIQILNIIKKEKRNGIKSLVSE